MDNIRFHGNPSNGNHYKTVFFIVLRFNDTSTLVGNFVSSSEKGIKETEEIVKEMKERDREERRIVMKVKKQKK